MRARSLLGVSALALGLAVAPLSAQGIFLAGSGTFPMGDYGTYAKTGWMAHGGVSLGLGSNANLGLRLEAFYGSNSHDDFEGGKTTLIGGMGSVTYAVGSNGKLYVIGGLGYMIHKFTLEGFDEDDSEGALAFAGGAGFNLTSSIFAEARYVNGTQEGGGTHFVTATLGIKLGGKKH